MRIALTALVAAVLAGSPASASITASQPAAKQVRRPWSTTARAAPVLAHRDCRRVSVAPSSRRWPAKPCTVSSQVNERAYSAALSP